MDDSLSSSDVSVALDTAISTVSSNAAKFGEFFPDDTTVDNRYQLRAARPPHATGSNHGWTTGFVAGMEWIAWERSGDPVLRNAASMRTQSFSERIRLRRGVQTHDLGFLYSLSCVADWRLTGNIQAAAAALTAAELLMARFLEPAGIIQAWGDLDDPMQRGRAIIDSLLNLPLLIWAAEQTGLAEMSKAVRRHALQLSEHIVRTDGSTFHTFTWDATTGEPIGGSTAQGAGDDSCWSRGQAWGIYGFALNYRATNDEALLEASRRCAKYFLDNVPDDGVPYWDFSFSEGSGAPRDSSAAAIAACGLMELAALEPDRTRGTEHRLAGMRILSSLIEHYAPDHRSASDALIAHGVYDLPGGIGIDEGTLWGDYFYLEALMRVTDPQWRPYW